MVIFGVMALASVGMTIFTIVKYGFNKVLFAFWWTSIICSLAGLGASYKVAADGGDWLWFTLLGVSALYLALHWVCLFVDKCGRKS